MKQEIIRLGSACNQKCLFCNQEEEIQKKTKKGILFELLLLKKKGVQKIVISGGEPTLFKQELIFTISSAKRLGFLDIEIQSNAVLLSNYDYVKELHEVGLNCSMISLHHYNDDVSDELTFVRGTFKKTINGIKNLIKVGIDTSINIVINKRNYKDILDYTKYIKNELEGFTGISFSIVVPGKLTLKNDLLPNYKDISPYLKESYQYCLENNIDFTNPGCGIPVCFIKDYYKYSLEYENYISKDKDFEFIFNKNSVNKIKSEVCKKCVFYKHCEGFWKKYVETYGFDGIKPILELE